MDKKKEGKGKEKEKGNPLISPKKKKSSKKMSKKLENEREIALFITSTMHYYPYHEISRVAGSAVVTLPEKVVQAIEKNWRIFDWYQQMLHAIYEGETLDEFLKKHKKPK